MKLILAIAAASLLAAACAGNGVLGPGAAPPPAGGEADLRARYQKYRSTGSPPYLDYESWKRQFGTPRDYTGSGS